MRRNLDQERGARIEAKARRECSFAFLAPLATSMLAGGGGGAGGGLGGLGAALKDSPSSAKGEVTSPVNIAINQPGVQNLQEQLVKGGALFLGGIILMMAVARLTKG
jgi:hypothetical protein